MEFEKGLKTELGLKFEETKEIVDILLSINICFINTKRYKQKFRIEKFQQIHEKLKRKMCLMRQKD